MNACMRANKRRYKQIKNNKHNKCQYSAKNPNQSDMNATDYSVGKDG